MIKITYHFNIYRIFAIRNMKRNLEPIEYKENTEALAKFAKALGHPVRMYVMQLLSKQSCCYSGDLTEELPIAKSTFSQHLKELKEAGLIQGEIESPRIKYCINKKNWKEAQQLFKQFLGI